ncbi:class I SAM-dependent methyltransferase [Marispirochaeta aestuarii]|uniref:class I SAM-dependent methyltransferase n=1 Tax=Marispirochaeta aestuarii TaxID=1963862 RepID=UPI0029C89B99|nr:class I SAM-dependent methyltransferase [Marispirochaeta aestuarii]
MKDSLRRLKEHYEPRIRPESMGYEILDWEDQESQFCRFDVLVRKIDLSGKSLLDLGCGVGDLCSYLQQKGIEASYTGVDILEKMILEARRRCPPGRFIKADLLRENPFGNERFQVAFCSGIFNLETGDNERLLDAYLTRLQDLTTEAVVINLLSIASRDQQDKYHYFDPDSVIKRAGGLFPLAEIEAGYLSNDFTLVCRHGSSSSGSRS